MIARSLVLATALAALAACSPFGGPPLPPAVDAPKAVAALEAFRAGDREAVKAVIADWDATHAEPPHKRPNLCSAEGYAERRAATMRGRLEALQERRVFSMPQEARLAYMDGAFLGAKPYPKRVPQIEGDLCRTSPGYEEHDRADEAEEVAIRRAYLKLRTDWWAELQDRYGEDAPARLKGAGELLRKNNMPGGHFSSQLAFGNV
jgi:hypothetical protein